MSEPGRYDRCEVIDVTHDLSQFQCGEPILDEWLKARALKNLALGASRTFVACRSGSKRVVGYYALAMGGLLSRDVTGSIRRNMPDVIPSVILGRLAVDQSAQGDGLGAKLLSDAIERSYIASREVSARLVVVHALSEQAERFYMRFGFGRMPGEGRVLAFDLMKYR